MYPYDIDKRKHADGKEFLEHCYKTAFSSSFLYEAFGQAGSNYDDGSPEKLAIGIRKFLSVKDNLNMLTDIGDKCLEHLRVLAVVNEREIISKKVRGTYLDGSKPDKDGRNNQIETGIKHWKIIKDEIMVIDPRTYDFIMLAIGEDVIIQEIKKEGSNGSKNEDGSKSTDTKD